MLRAEAGRLLRKIFVLAVLLACLTAVNTDNGVRKVAAQTSCCQTCQNSFVDCMNNCQTPYCPQTVCIPRYNYCRSQCNPPCS